MIITTLNNVIICIIHLREPRRKDFEFDRGDTERYRNYDRFKGSSFDRRRNDSFRTQEEPEWMTGICFNY